MNSELLNFRCAANERVNRHGIRAFHIADNVILAKKFNVIRAATLLELRTDSGSTRVNNGFRAGVKSVFGLNGELNSQRANGSRSPCEPRC